MTPRRLSTPWNLDQLVAFAFGAGFILLLIILAAAIPNPSDSTFFIFRVVLAVAAAGFVAAIPGLMNIRWSEGRRLQIRASGALAAFLLIYLVNPAPLVNPHIDVGRIIWEVSPTELTQGREVRIRWQVEKAETVFIDPIGTASQKGELVEQPRSDTRYKLVVYRDNYPVELRSTLVRVAPSEPGAPVIHDFRIAPQEVVLGRTQSAIVSWRVSDASEIEIREAKVRTFALDGSEEIEAPGGDTRYVLEAVNRQTDRRSTAVATVKVVTPTPTATPVPTQTPTPTATPTATATPRRGEYRLSQVEFVTEVGCNTRDYRLTVADAGMIIDTGRGDGGHTVITRYFSRNSASYGPSVTSPGSFDYSVQTGVDALGRPQKTLMVTLCATERKPLPFTDTWVTERLIFDFILYARTP